MARGARPLCRGLAGAGLLFLGINDCTFTGDFYNTGQFSVVIKIERAGGYQ